MLNFFVLKQLLLFVLLAMLLRKFFILFAVSGAFYSNNFISLDNFLWIIILHSLYLKQQQKGCSRNTYFSLLIFSSNGWNAKITSKFLSLFFIYNCFIDAWYKWKWPTSFNKTVIQTYLWNVKFLESFCFGLLPHFLFFFFKKVQNRWFF